MIIVNRIVNILILLAAIAAVVFSYMLFSKREKLLDGWKQMATAIHTAARTLDDGGASGTAAAKDLPVDKMLHTNYEQLGQVLPKLDKNVKEVILQRNGLAKGMTDVAEVLGINEVSEGKLRNVASYKDQNSTLLSRAKTFREVRDGVTDAYSQTGRVLGVSVSSSSFRAKATYRTSAAKIDDAARDLIQRKNVYQSYLIRFSQSVGVKTPGFAKGVYSQNLEYTRRAIASKMAEFSKTKRDLANEKAKTKRLDNQNKNLNKVIVARNATIKKQSDDIKFLRNVLSKDGTIKLPEKLLTSKDIECYKEVRGKIQYVDKEYGFITVNLGRNYVFIQQYGIKKNAVHFPMKAGFVMTVVRRYGEENPDTIGKVKITKVDKDLSVCNILDGKPEKYMVGDTVIFTDDDVKLAVEVGKKK